MAEEVYNSLEYTPTWVVAVVCFVIVLISLVVERGIHRLGKCLQQRRQLSLFEALQKLKEELMVLGFISLLLTVFQAVNNHICIPESLTNSMLPCKKHTKETKSSNQTEHFFQPTWARRLLSEGGSKCPKGQVPFMSQEALHQLHIFIFVLALVYVIFSATTMVLGEMKVKRWKHWEQSIQREISTASHRVSHIHEAHHRVFMQRALGSSSVADWICAFFKQFYGSVTKSDYIALRLGFIKTHCPSNPKFDFHKYMMRTLQHDFKKVVGISWFLWAFVVLFLLVNLEGWHSYFYMSFLPLILLLLVGAKLQNIITSLAREIVEKEKIDEEGNKREEGDTGGEPWVKPSDKHFWFGRPGIVLYLIHFILFQNSFEIAFFFWVLCTYGIHSCIFDRIEFIVPRLVVGVLIQVLCSYSTLPLYTIVSQMGSMFKQGIFDEQVRAIINQWIGESRHNRGFETRTTVAGSVELVPSTGTQQTVVLVDEPTSHYEEPGVVQGYNSFTC